MAKSKGLTRPITRKQAQSYTSTTPNGMGVTAIASVNGRRRKKLRIKLSSAQAAGLPLRRVRKNGRGPLTDHHGRSGSGSRGKATANKKKAARRKPTKAEYKKRYASTQMILRRPSKAPPRPRASKKRIYGIPAFHVGDQFPVIVPPAPRRRRRASTPKETVMKRKSKSRKSKRTPAQRAAFKRMLAGLAKYKKKHTGGRKRKAAPKKRTHRHAAKRRAHRNGPVMKTAVANKKRRKSTSRAGKAYGRYRSVVARVGRKKLPTYMYQTKRGLKHIPLYAIAGQKSARKFSKLTSSQFGTLSKTQQKARRRVAAVMRQRERAAKRVGRQGDIFTPNRKGTVVPYETWSASMTPNRRKRRAKKSARKASTHHKRRKHAARRPKAHRTRKHARTSSKRSAAARKAAKTRAKKHEIRVRAARKAARTRKRRAHRNPKVAVANRRRRRVHANRRHHHAVATPNRRRRHARKNKATANRRRSYLPMHVRRFKANKRRSHRYSANPFKAGDFKKRIISALKIGLVAAVGFGAHRAATKFLSDQVLAKMGLSTGPVAQYRGLIAGLIVAGVSIPLMEKVAPKQAGEFNSGVFVSFVHSLLTTLLNAAGQTGIAAALSAYPDAEGRAYHGTGEYMPVNGFGAYEMAGLGSPMLSQAAAGFGAIPVSTRYGRGPMLSQAAAGFGGPMLSQAAAGTGEYLAQGVQGIGDYEMVSGTGSAFGAVDDGIRPDLRSAERALNISEAAAGVSLGDLPTASQLNPTMLAQPVEDAPDGMRSGILQGGDGIFG